MNMTVSARIGGGFALLVLLLLIISATSFRSLGMVDRQLAVTTEQITPIIVRSAEMSLSLLSSNKSVLLFMDVSEPEALDAQSASFEQQQTNYLAQREALQQLAATYPTVTDILTQLDGHASSYFETAQQALNLHRQELEVEQMLSQAVLALNNEIRFYKADIDLLVTYGLPEEQSGGRELKTNLEAIEGEFKSLLAATQLDQVTPIVESFATEGYGFSLLGMRTRLDGLIKGGSEIAADLTKFMDAIQASATAPDGVTALKQRQIEAHDALKAMIEKLSNSANSSSAALDELMRGAQQIAAQVKADTDNQVQRSQLIDVVISIFSVILAAVIGLWVSRNIRNSLKRIISVLRQIADGDLSRRVEKISRDEFGQLAGYVNELADKQEQVIRQIHSAADEINHSAVEASEVSSRTDQMMTEQQQQTIQVAAAIQEMSTTVANVAQSAEQAQSEVQHIDESAQNNRQLMEQNVRQVSSLTTEIERSAGVISQLHNDTVDIGKILVVIEEIAEQTNLLALNAAIEAARAGEQGRGFAVVADEVRTLASRTQNSTQEIQAMIEKLQKGAKNAVDIMQSSQAQAQSSLEQTNLAGDSLLAMVEQLDQVKQKSIEIAAAAEQQNAVSSEISKSVQQIATAAELGAQEAQTSARGSETLALLAHRQKEVVSQFTLS
ncbi:MAG: methyl-accepting chemotaxis protein [Pseudomonadales bacterium]